MTKEAKNLLENKTCGNCTGYNYSPWDGAICLWFNKLFPKENTCKDWSNDPKRYGHTKRHI